MGHTVKVSTRPDPGTPGRTRTPGQRIPTCRYLTGRGNTTDRCTAEPVTSPDDSIELCARHLGLSVAAYNRIAATIQQ